MCSESREIFRGKFKPGFEDGFIKNSPQYEPPLFCEWTKPAVYMVQLSYFFVKYVEHLNNHEGERIK
jgi:hypothetical protein